MDDNSFEKIKSILNSSNIPSDLQSILSNMNSSNNVSDSSTQNNGISPEAINNLVSMLNSHSNSNSNSESFEGEKSGNTDNSNQNSSKNSIDLETIMKFKTIMDKMNSKDDPRSKLLISLKPYLKDSRKNKLDQYIQFLNMSKVINIFSKTNGDGKL